MPKKKIVHLALVLVYGLLIAALISILGLQNAYTSDLMDLNDRLLGPLNADDPAMLTLLRERYILPPDHRPYNISSDNYLYNKHNRAYGISIAIKIQEVFSHIHGGFFIEAGALDGVYLSNTLWLEQKRGWTGLLVEPNIFSYRELVSKHRKAWVSNTCLSSTQYPRQTVLVTLSPKSWYDKQMNIKGSAHEYGINQADINTELFFNSANRHLTNVQCFPLVSYLIALNVSTVDFLSLDIQGPERAVLDTLPWESVNIRTMVIEMNSEVKDREFLNVMTKRGYKSIHFTDNEFLFVKNGDPLLDAVNFVPIEYSFLKS